MNPTPPPRRVLMTADTIGGVWTYALELARALGKEGIQVGLATMGARLSPSQWAEVGLIPSVEVFESHYKLEWMDNPWEDVTRAGNWLLQLEDQFRPDLIHLNGYTHGALPWRAPKMVVSHSCVLSWWRAVKSADAPAGWGTYRASVTRGLRAADLVVAPSNAMLAAVNHYYGALGSTAVIPNGRELHAPHSSRKEPFIFAAGRLWDEAKNMDAVARIAPELRWPVCVAGDTRDPDGRETQYPHVFHLGRLNPAEMISTLQRASIYALPARYEPFGLSVLEAAHARCALVLGDIPSLRENWDGAADFVSPDDAAGLKAALETLIADPDRLARQAAAAHRRAAQFTIDRMSAGYLAAYVYISRPESQAGQAFESAGSPELPVRCSDERWQNRTNRHAETSTPLTPKGAACAL